ncbi:hypothetical protein PR003_g1441 [Phytophthora rubi]|uniref:Uncharacterized protein n=1 Tax=Phytophthora rubi TaxID=129364 RepID=A0A6A4G2D6_9STRA|nr:hypothetical protein PR002_g9838 [Phytophthora rubi]KAE9034354.1 hypothetical protein PR001_g9769 [Phytophthora rubi]KAE9358178.1 hypothetical protein PR003_g1441 [Phytophthora rubi]
MCWVFVFAERSSTVGEQLSKIIDDATLTFKAQAVFDDKDVAFYNFAGTDACNQANDVLGSAQYADYEGLHVQLVQLLTNNQDGIAPNRSALLKASLLHGRKSKKGVVNRPAQRHHSPHPRAACQRHFLRRHKASR